MSVHRVAVLVLDGVVPLDMAIPVQVFASADAPSYQVGLCAPGAAVRSSGGFMVSVADGLDRLDTADTVIVPGSSPPVRRLSPDVRAALQGARSRGARVVSICTGAFPLAAAGLLDGLRATTHWHHLDELEHDYPLVGVDRGVLYVDQGDVLTSAGVCAGIDLCLHIVRRDLGSVIANQVAGALVAPPHREGGQAQYVPAPVAVTPGGSLAATRTWATDRLAEPLTVDALARHAGMAPRSFLRHFARETGTTPLQWLLTARVGRARELLETTDRSIDDIARACGMGTATNLRVHFRRALGTTPTAYRTTFGG